MARYLTDSWQMAQILTDNWHLYPPPTPIHTLRQNRLLPRLTAARHDNIDFLISCVNISISQRH